MQFNFWTSLRRERKFIKRNKLTIFLNEFW